LQPAKSSVTPPGRAVTAKTASTSLRGTAFEKAGPRPRLATPNRWPLGLGRQPGPGTFHVFRVEPDDVTFIRWGDATNDQYVTRWPAGTEIVLHGISASGGQVQRGEMV